MSRVHEHLPAHRSFTRIEIQCRQQEKNARYIKGRLGSRQQNRRSRGLDKNFGSAGSVSADRANNSSTDIRQIAGGSSSNLLRLTASDKHETGRPSWESNWADYCSTERRRHLVSIVQTHLPARFCQDARQTNGSSFYLRLLALPIRASMALCFRCNISVVPFEWRSFGLALRRARCKLVRALGLGPRRARMLCGIFLYSAASKGSG